MKESPAEIRWKDHKKFIQKGIRFQPEYSALIDSLCLEKKVSKREVVEEALKALYGDPKKGFGDPVK